MNIMEVMKRENLGKRYTSKGREFVLKESLYSLWLKDEKTKEVIEDNFTLDEILQMEFVEIVDVDWSKVPIDTKILVSGDGKDWYRRYFAKYENGIIYAFPDGLSSFTAGYKPECGYRRVCSWEYAKLYEEQDKLKGEVYDDKRK